MEADRIARRAERGDPLWPAQLSLALVVALTFGLTDKVTIGPTWLLPGLEALVLLALVVIAPSRANAAHPRSRAIALGLIAVVSLANVASLALLAHYLISGGRASGHRLLVSGVVLWATNVLLFAVWYWELDGGGPGARFARPEGMRDFRFPQQDAGGPAFARWGPGFLDYLYVSLTNATAFSPTDTMPLTHTAKGVMGVQSVAALVTIGLVVARAVNILG